MAKYLVLYRASRSAQEQMASGTPEQAQAGMELWMDHPHFHTPGETGIEVLEFLPIPGT